MLESPSGEEGMSGSELSMCEPDLRELEEWSGWSSDSDEILVKSREMVEAEPTNVKGRLHDRVEFWRSVLKAPQSVISVIENGYILPLSAVPDHYHRPNHHSTKLD